MHENSKSMGKGMGKAAVTTAVKAPGLTSIDIDTFLESIPLGLGLLCPFGPLKKGKMVNIVERIRVLAYDFDTP